MWIWSIVISSLESNFIMRSRKIWFAHNFHLIIKSFLKCVQNITLPLSCFVQSCKKIWPRFCIMTTFRTKYPCGNWIFPDSYQNFLTFAWLSPHLEFPWLCCDYWTPCIYFLEYKNCFGNFTSLLGPGGLTICKGNPRLGSDSRTQCGDGPAF